MFLPQDIDAYNTAVGDWTADTKGQVISEMDALGIVHSQKSKSPVAAKKALRTSLRKNAGVTNRISFKIPRHMVFVHKGVGRGTKISQVGTTKRKPKPFLNPVIEKNISKLADVVADHQGTMVIHALMIK